MRLTGHVVGLVPVETGQSASLRSMA